ncbi:MAG: Rrf2 family transcriptional regulator [Kiritimatiellia bacterium]
MFSALFGRFWAFLSHFWLFFDVLSVLAGHFIFLYCFPRAQKRHIRFYDFDRKPVLRSAGCLLKGFDIAMKISTRGRYGLRVLLDIALHQQDGPVALRDIAARQDISQKYLWQVLNPLKTAGLLNTVRGAQGGCMLAKEPKEVTVLDVVNILEGSTALVDCLNKPGTCNRGSRCATQKAWGLITKAMQTSMREITLEDLKRWQKECDDTAGSSYEI